MVRGMAGNNEGRRPEPYQRWPSMQLDFLWEAVVSHCIGLSKIRILRKLSLTVMYQMAQTSV